jgi:hypothetical protein
MKHILTIAAACLAFASGALAADDSPFNTSRMPYRAFDELPATTINVGDSSVVIGYAPGGEFALPKTEIAAWVERSARTVAGYYGHFPVKKYRLLIMPVAGSGVRGGTTWGFRGAATKLRLGQGSTMAQLDTDWVLIHEMIHTAFPSMEERHHWIEEGLATYIESIARVQSGNLDAGVMWNSLVTGMPHGEPGVGDGGLDNTHTWGRTYWGGALFCLTADVQIRERTGNKMGLQDALRGIVNAGGSIEREDWTLDHTLEIADRATGTRVLEELYAKNRDAPVDVDLAALWQKLGISVQGGRVVFDDKAPLANVRRAITARQ